MSGRLAIRRRADGTFGWKLTKNEREVLTHLAKDFRALLTVEETWAQHQGRSETISEIFRRINFWRSVLKVAEDRLSR